MTKSLAFPSSHLTSTLDVMAFVGGETSCPCCFRPGLDRPKVCMPVGGPKTTSSKLDVVRQLRVVALERAQRRRVRPDGVAQLAHDVDGALERRLRDRLLEDVLLALDLRLELRELRLRLLALELVRDVLEHEKRADPSLLAVSMDTSARMSGVSEKLKKRDGSPAPSSAAALFSSALRALVSLPV